MNTPACTLSEALEQVLSLLRAAPVHQNHDRANVRRADGKALQCVILGAYTSQGAGLTRRTEKAVASGLVDAIMKAVACRGQALPFSSICVTQNGQAPPHRDKNNHGLTSIITCGQFRGGELIIENVAGRKYIPVTDDTKVAASALQCRSCWNYFSAQNWHMVLPFRGERVSIALYCCRNLHRVGLQGLRRLSELGFMLPASPELIMEGQSPDRY
eukprot:3583777-Amphidinium_carterae.2